MGIEPILSGWKPEFLAVRKERRKIWIRREAYPFSPYDIPKNNDGKTNLVAESQIRTDDLQLMRLAS